MLRARVSKEEIPSMYRWIAPTHDLLAVLVESHARRRGLEQAAVRDGEQILEVAVGTGLSFEYLIRHNPTGHNTGVDLTPAMLARARRRSERVFREAGLETPNYTLIEGDAYALPFPDRHFDLVLNSYMFDLLPEDDFVPVLEEFKRVLKPGGRLVQINMTEGAAWYNGFWENLYRIHPRLLGGCRGVTMAPFFRKAGFDRVEREYISQRTFPSEVVRGIRPD